MLQSQAVEYAACLSQKKEYAACKVSSNGKTLCMRSKGGDKKAKRKCVHILDVRFLHWEVALEYSTENTKEKRKDSMGKSKKGEQQTKAEPITAKLMQGMRLYP